ncbi:RWD domain-containing protein 1 [Trichonephila inaurata madagascariensis]|uniref:RWD domain-containing protein 1 n=1 Tax=Trichonephila inaurata madagascariensis TaxID=2747483 RepID=A0A8X7CG16_9ARAC|nr:RWD domain-containing protein 1 [Trichonephila inaurata madagascariensis]
MTDYLEEQRNEIEALESIYPSELTIISDSPYSFTMDIKTECLEDDPDEYMAVSLKFTYVPSYPDEAPVVEIEDCENFSDQDVEDLTELINSKIEENLGMVMVYTIVFEASEWLNKRLVTSISERKEAEVLRIKKAEEEERNRFEGIRVTVESFMSWKAKFDQEMAELRKLQSKEEAASKKLTGRELFEKDHSLVDSDLKFLQDETEVKVDESLFQELDDLELQDDEDISS